MLPVNAFAACAEFAEDRNRLAVTAAAIRAAVMASKMGELAWLEEDGVAEASEGAILTPPASCP
jgi:hypothetical protein